MFQSVRSAAAAAAAAAAASSSGVSRQSRQWLLLQRLGSRTSPHAHASTNTTTTSCSSLSASYMYVATRSLGSDAGSATHTIEKEIADCVHSLSSLTGSEHQQQVAIATLLSSEARQEITQAAQKAAAAASSTQAAAEEQDLPQPSRRDLRLVVLNNAIPFIGFGFMDNAILILAGDLIDNSLGVVLGISTLCAAALGNIISDVAGVGLGTVIEDYCARLGLPQPNLTQAQRQLRSVRFSNQFGCALGLVVGCLIGMFPLLFLDAEKAEHAKHESHLDDIFKYMVTEAKVLIGAEYTCLFLVVDKENDVSPMAYKKRERRSDGYLYGKYIDGVKRHAHVPIGTGILSQCAISGETVSAVNIDEKGGDEGDKDEGASKPDNSSGSGSDCSADVAKALGIPQSSIQNTVCVPIQDARGNVLAVIQAVNKVETGQVPSGRFLRRRQTADWKQKGFTEQDIQILRALATRISISLEGMQNEDDRVHLRDTIQILKQQGALELI